MVSIATASDAIGTERLASSGWERELSVTHADGLHMYTHSFCMTPQIRGVVVSGCDGAVSTGVWCVGVGSSERSVLPHPPQYDYLQQILGVMHCTAKGTQRWSAVTPDKTSKGEKQPFKASVDLCLVVLWGPMQSIIDLGAIIERPA